jgi:hypothetical protein
LTATENMPQVFGIHADPWIANLDGGVRCAVRKSHFNPSTRGRKLHGVFENHQKKASDPRSISVDTLSAARKFLRELDTLGHRQNGTLIFQSFNVWMRSTLLNRSRLHWHRRGPAPHRPQPIYRLRVMVHFRSILVEICEYPPKLFPPVGKRRKNPTGLPPLSAAAIEFSPC